MSRILTCVQKMTRVVLMKGRDEHELLNVKVTMKRLELTKLTCMIETVGNLFG